MDKQDIKDEWVLLYKSNKGKMKFCHNENDSNNRVMTYDVAKKLKMHLQKYHPDTPYFLLSLQDIV